MQINRFLLIGLMSVSLSSCATWKTYSACTDAANDAYKDNKREIVRMSRLYGKSISSMNKAYVETRSRMKEKCLEQVKFLKRD